VGYSEAAQRAFYRRQVRRLVELIERCDDARTVAAVLQAAIYCLEKTERRSIAYRKRRPVSIAELKRSVLH
jgi:hypothetical protein